MQQRPPSRTERLAEVRKSLAKVYEANDLPPRFRDALEQLEREPPDQPAKT